MGIGKTFLTYVALMRRPLRRLVPSNGRPLAESTATNRLLLLWTKPVALAGLYQTSDVMIVELSELFLRFCFDLTFFYALIVVKFVDGI